MKRPLGAPVVITALVLAVVVGCSSAEESLRPTEGPSDPSAGRAQAPEASAETAVDPAVAELVLEARRQTFAEGRGIIQTRVGTLEGLRSEDVRYILSVPRYSATTFAGEPDYRSPRAGLTLVIGDESFVLPSELGAPACYLRLDEAAAERFLGPRAPDEVGLHPSMLVLRDLRGVEAIADDEFAGTTRLASALRVISGRLPGAVGLGLESPADVAATITVGDEQVREISIAVDDLVDAAEAAGAPLPEEVVEGLKADEANGVIEIRYAGSAPVPDGVDFDPRELPDSVDASLPPDQLRAAVADCVASRSR